ncbi:MAG: hypothetical protein PHS53_05255 [Candidatus Pacebacteria bacterium]|nr:hypothetical protein [Candidatus Paceibacterota bacterium]
MSQSWKRLQEEEDKKEAALRLGKALATPSPGRLKFRANRQRRHDLANGSSKKSPPKLAPMPSDAPGNMIPDAVTTFQERYGKEKHEPAEAEEIFEPFQRTTVRRPYGGNVHRAY